MGEYDALVDGDEMSLEDFHAWQRLQAIEGIGKWLARAGEVEGLSDEPRNEHELQAALVRWAKLEEPSQPDLWLLHAIPNGGKRHIAVARRMKAEGQKPGVPDLSLPVARGGYCGLYMETKFGHNKPSGEQKKWHEALRRAGNLVLVYYTLDEGKAILNDYLSKPPTLRLSLDVTMGPE